MRGGVGMGVSMRSMGVKGVVGGLGGMVVKEDRCEGIGNKEDEWEGWV